MPQYGHTNLRKKITEVLKMNDHVKVDVKNITSHEITFEQYVKYLGFQVDHLTPQDWSNLHQQFDHDYEAYCWMRLCIQLDGIF